MREYDNTGGNSMSNLPAGPDDVERPLPLDLEQNKGVWGSDAIAEMIAALDIPYIALNPGSSFRGIHDSLVNWTGNRRPQMLLCIHEESAVAICHGWGKVTGRAMAAFVHSNVGLMHASMGLYNAWCDRAPVLLFGAVGPVDAAKRRPWIDWLHTAKDQGSIVRHYVKWDDQPASIGAAQESVLRARQIAETLPCGPTYVVFDTAMQEAKLDGPPPPMPDPDRYRAPAPIEPGASLVADVARPLAAAQRPLILAGRVSRSEQGWADRIALAEMLGAVVLADMKSPGAFPTDHPLMGATPAPFVSPGGCELMRQADVVLNLNWYDLAGTLKQAWGDDTAGSTIINVSLDQYVHNGWSMDHQALPPSDVYVMADPDPTVAALLQALPPLLSKGRTVWPDRKPPPPPPVRARPAGPNRIGVADLVSALRRALEGHDVCLMRQVISWPADLWPVTHPLDFMGNEGGGGIGAGPGLTVGAGLALRGSGRLAVSVLGDGDFLMGATAVWTAVRYGVPLLIVVANNHAFYNDELHQEKMARQRGRPVENKWIGQRLIGPEIDIAMVARAQGAHVPATVRKLDELESVLKEAIAATLQGHTVVVDVEVEPNYEMSMLKAMLGQSHD